MRRRTILGLSGSLRRARASKGAATLATEIAGLATREDLDAYLSEQANIHLEAFVQAGRKEGKPFDELYRELQRNGGLRGLSNSEVGLVAALWGAYAEGCDIDCLALADYFTADGGENNLDELKAKVLAADGIILATPVYFGDRSSIAQRFIEMARADDQLLAAARDKVFAGVAVGAKRNGGQETTLIYQLLDMLETGFLGVGNDAKTTSQYGGTGHAGDIGTMPKDKYGIDTCIGTGRRIAEIAEIIGISEIHELSSDLKVALWILQDRDQEMARRLSPFIAGLGEQVETKVLNLLDWKIRPCIACDICPTKIGTDDEYRCIIGRTDDGLKANHADVIEADVIIPAVFSPKDRRGLDSVYQQFMERTRYLRRGDYVFTNHLIAPLIFAEIGINEHLDVRMVTSFVRHHTVLCRPVVGWLHNGELINADEVREGLATVIAQGRRLLTGRLGSYSRIPPMTHYQPVGYVLAQAIDREDKAIVARERAVTVRNSRLREAAETRLATDLVIVERAAR